MLHAILISYLVRVTGDSLPDYLGRHILSEFLNLSHEAIVARLIWLVVPLLDVLLNQTILQLQRDL